MRVSLQTLSTNNVCQWKLLLKTIIWFSFLMSFVFIACKSHVPIKEIEFCVKDGVTLKPIRDAKVVITAPGQTPDTIDTDQLGRANIRVKDFIKNPDTLDACMLEWSATVFQDGCLKDLKDKTYLNKYIHYYDLYLIDTAAHPKGTRNLTVDPTADMHYHISMRAHNHFGEWLYPVSKDNPTPQDITWYKSYKKLKILNPNIGIDPSMNQANEHSTVGLDDNAVRLLQGHVHSYDKSGSNKLTQYTQATHPHLLEGNVQLAYDAISPFEQATSKTWRNRLAGNLFVTGARAKWMQKMGQVDDDRIKMTHWKNFNLEYNTITKQDTAFNNFHWRFLNKKDSLIKGTPTVVLVVEGSHILQDTLFPNFVNYNIGERSIDENLNLLNKILDDYQNKEPILERLLPDSFTSSKDTSIYQKNQTKKLIDQLDTSSIFDRIDPIKTDNFVQEALESELRNNIISLKKLDPPICMMTVSHLAYNGMTGHSVAWDQGGFLNNLVARRNYGLRVSEDRQYKSQWEGAFFSIPGVNKFGELVINDLISKANGHRILIDLKHSAPSTRQFFLDSIMVPKINSSENDTVFPICSHCGVNGFPRMYSSPLVNEYNVARAPFVHNLYPFAINLYDDEITQICKYEGIIGIPLEQRILGSYLNKVDKRTPKIKQNGKREPAKIQYIKRWSYVKRYLKYIFLTKPDTLKSAIDYTTTNMGIRIVKPYTPESPRDSLRAYKEVLKVIYTEYKSCEPFLYNVFHVIDHSKKDPSIAWKYVCIGSDLDGLVDPIDICPTASQYPKFKERLKQFIPVFLEIRQVMNLDYHEPSKGYTHYFGQGKISMNDALDQLFFQSLFDFTAKRILK